MPSEQGEGRVDFFLARSVGAQPFIDCGQFIARRLVFGAGEFRLDFQRNFRQLLWSVLRPGVGTRSNTALT